MPYTNKNRENHQKLMAKLNEDRRKRRRTRGRNMTKEQILEGIQAHLKRYELTHKNAYNRLLKAKDEAKATAKAKAELKNPKTISPKNIIQPIEKNSIVGSIMHVPSGNINLPIINTGIVTLPNKGNRTPSINKGNKSRIINNGNRTPNTKKICTNIGCFPKSFFPSFSKFFKNKKK